jgi:hypothetical protein
MIESMPGTKDMSKDEQQLSSIVPLSPDDIGFEIDVGSALLPDLL